MDQGPLVTEQIEVGGKFVREFHKFLPLQSAFWLKDSEEGAWYLYLASDLITDDSYGDLYGDVGRIADSLQDPMFDVFQVKLIGADDKLAKAAADLQRRYGGRAPARLFNTSFGGMGVDEVYLYPIPAAVSG